MKVIRSYFLLALTLLFLARASLTTAQDLAVGAHLFHQYCASCHGETGNGNGPVAPYLTLKPSDLRAIAERRQGRFPAEQILRIVAGDENPPGHGTRAMPVWGERFQEELIGGVDKPAVARGRIAFLVEYLKTLQGAGRKDLENVVIPTEGLRPDQAPRP